MRSSEKPDSARLLALLQQHFGYSTFRPFQQEIIADVLARRDVFALLPTGGGKSLCFQLPAIAQPGLTVVVSPLIALMKDQVDALQACGIAATFINSSLNPGEARERLNGLERGEYKLLYVAPERLMMESFLAELKRWNVILIAIDEAHCISEWGHDFRPEYRQLARLRGIFSSVPILALTATATERVRGDICQQLQLQNPSLYQASFNRPNLTYTVRAKKGSYSQLLSFVRKRATESGIIYGQSRKTAESLAEQLSKDGIAARPYHAGLTPEQRARNQEAFLRDEVKVICATIAFGMGINKPNVRFVVHYDLPKNIEGYYQETGRAGRDGLPSDCLLLFSAGDVVKYKALLERDKTDAERVIANEQIQQMVRFAESVACRRAALLQYFGETYPEPNCGSCDNCTGGREQYDATIPAQKFLSCVYRLKEKSGFSFGLAHTVNVLLGSRSQKILQFQHDTVSTFGKGAELSADDWKAIGRELIRLGYVQEQVDRMNTLEVTAEGMSVLKKREKILVFRPAKTSETAEAQVGETERKSSPSDDKPYDKALFEQLRELRKKLAAERDVPPYIILSDVSLRQMSREYPTDLRAVSRISGFGEKKLIEFGAIFVEEIVNFLKVHPRQSFPSAQGPVREIRRSTTILESSRMFQDGKTLAQIAAVRGLARSTIVAHLSDAILAGERIDISSIVPATARGEIEEAFQKIGFSNLTGVKEYLENRFDFEVLHLMRATLQARSTQP